MKLRWFLFRLMVILKSWMIRLVRLRFQRHEQTWNHLLRLTKKDYVIIEDERFNLASKVII